MTSDIGSAKRPGKMIQVRNKLPQPDAGLGLLRAEGVQPDYPVPALDHRLAALLEARQADLPEPAETVRQAARDLLRNGRYKPTGRGKPASEYLLRAAQRAADGARAFPRINGPVDACNYISLKYLVPISLWDLDRAGTARFVFRLGDSEEAYVFNSAGQVIALEDLVVGCRVTEHAAAGEPIVNPVKDSMATKTTPDTTRVAASIYAPLNAVPADALQAICVEFRELLAACGPAVDVAHAVVLPGEERSV